VLTVIAFAADQAEGPLFENRVVAVPERQGEAEQLLPVADAEQPILIPAIGFGASLIVRQIVPRRAVGAVVFAHGAPGALAQVRSPALPVRREFVVLMQPFLFLGCRV